ncbi:MAG: helix-turn-helix domain-containing protein, partial [Mycobacteriaceae bacterium]|nr:helix-turn-helix domain-containing protein [Mycobacteriaceae bacterium]
VGAALGSGFGAATNAYAQQRQHELGHRPEFDLLSLAEATVTGAVGGLTGAGTALRYGPRLAGLFGAATARTGARRFAGSVAATIANGLLGGSAGAVTGVLAAIPFRLSDFRLSELPAAMGPALVTGIGGGFLGSAVGGLRAAHSAEAALRAAPLDRRAYALAALHGLPGTPPPPEVPAPPPRALAPTGESPHHHKLQLVATMQRAIADAVGPEVAPVRITGLQHPNVDTDAARDVTSAVGDMLRRHSDTPLREVRIVDFGPDATNIARSRMRTDHYTIELNLRYLANPEWFAQVQRAAYLNGADSMAAANADPHHVGYHPPGTGRHAYDAVVHEFGHLKNRATGMHVSGNLDRILADAYAALPEMICARTGYDEWIGRLSGYSFDDGGINPLEAGPEAFADIEINGPKPGTAQQAIHDALTSEYPPIGLRPRSPAENQFLDWIHGGDGTPRQSLPDYATMHGLDESQLHRWLTDAGIDATRYADVAPTPVPRPEPDATMDRWAAEVRDYLAVTPDQMDALLDLAPGAWADVEAGLRRLTTPQLRSLVRRIPGAHDVYAALAETIAPALAPAGAPRYPEAHQRFGGYLTALRDAAGLRQRELAERIPGLTQGDVSKHESGRAPTRSTVESYLRALEPADVTYAELAECFPELPPDSVRYPDVRTAESFREYAERLRRINQVSRPELAELLGIAPTTLKDFETGRHTPSDVTMLRIYDQFLHQIGPWNDLAEAWGYRYWMDPRGETAPRPGRAESAGDWIRSVRLYRRLEQAELARQLGVDRRVLTDAENNIRPVSSGLLDAVAEAAGIPHVQVAAAREQFGIEGGDIAAAPVHWPDPRDTYSLNDYISMFQHQNGLSVAEAARHLGVSDNAVRYGATASARWDEVEVLRLYDASLHRIGPWNDLAAAWGYGYRMDPAGETAPTPHQYAEGSDWLRAVRLHARLSQADCAELLGRSRRAYADAEVSETPLSFRLLQELRDGLDLPVDTVTAARRAFGIAVADARGNPVKFPGPGETTSFSHYVAEFRQRYGISISDAARVLHLNRSSLDSMLKGEYAQPSDVTMLRLYDMVLHRTGPWNDLAEAWGYDYRMNPEGETLPDPVEYREANDWVQSCRLWARLTKTELADRMGRDMQGIGRVENGTIGMSQRFLRQLADALDLPEATVEAARRQFGLQPEPTPAPDRTPDRAATPEPRQTPEGSQLAQPDSTSPPPSLGRRTGPPPATFDGHVEYYSQWIVTPPELLMLRAWDNYSGSVAEWNTLAESWGYSYRMDPAGEALPDPLQYATLHDWVQATRLFNRLSQDELADTLSYSDSTISHVENGGSPSLTFLRTLRDQLNLPHASLHSALDHFEIAPYRPDDPDHGPFWELIDTRVGSEREQTLRNRIFDQHAWIAHAAAWRWRTSPEPQPELAQRFQVAILAAVLNHAPRSPFSAHAWATCRGAVFRAYFERRFPDLDNATRRIVIQINAYRNRRYQDTQTMPDQDEIGAALNLSDWDVVTALRAIEESPLRLDVTPDDGSPLEVSAPAEDPGFTAAITEALAQLPDPDLAERAVRLHFIEGLTIDETATVLQIPHATAAELLRAATPLLRAAFRPQPHD